MATGTANIAVDEILKARGAIYGNPTPNLAGTEEIWRVIDTYWVPPKTSCTMERDALKASVKMVAFKLMRIVCGRKDHWDNYDDLIGYLEIARDQARAIANDE